MCIEIHFIEFDWPYLYNNKNDLLGELELEV